MTREQMLHYMEEPALLNEKTLAELREILDEFPYFQTAHLLYIRNLQNENNFRFANQLKISAIHATDRTVLYHLLNPIQKNRKDTRSLEIDISTKGKDGSLIELQEDVPVINESQLLSPFIKIMSQEEGQHDLLSFETGESAYRLEGEDFESGKPLAELVKEINNAAEKNKSILDTEPKEDLIDRFIKENPTFSVHGSNTQENSYNPIDLDDNSNENDEFITETLARIYMKQGLYQKAINAFQRLSLKYPEKSVYFARQIEEVTNLLNK